MGCDVHFVLERKHDDKWIGVFDYPYLPTKMYGAKDLGLFPVIRGRNYEYFGDLCDGVRGHASSFGFNERGLPSDMSELTRFLLHDDVDIHSQTWLTLDEFCQVLEKHFDPGPRTAARLQGEYVNIAAEYVHPYIESSEHDQYRMCIGFDN